MMRLDANQHYMLKNGMFAHIEKFFPGDETEPACFIGAIATRGMHTWRPDGASSTHSDFDIIRRATPEETKVYLKLVGHGEDVPPNADTP